jgi:hypothetical protein
MTKAVSICALIVVGGLLAAIVVLAPSLLSDGSGFLKDFVGANLLLVSGVVLTITLASAGQLHLTLNDVEARFGRQFLHKTRAGVHSSAYWLIGLFLGAVVAVVLKPYFLSSVAGQAFFNGASLFILFWMVLIMASLTRLVFAIKPHFPIPPAPTNQPAQSQQSPAPPSRPARK